MKIAIVRQECSYSKGGAERYAANLCRELCDLGHTVHLVAEVFDETIHPEIHFTPVKVNRTSSATRTLSFHSNAQKAISSIKPDKTIALSRTFPADIFRVSDPLHASWMKTRYGSGLRHKIESLNPRHRAILSLENSILSLNNTTSIVTNSNLSKELILEQHTYPSENIHVVYNGIDLNRFTPPKTHSHSTKLLFVGQDFRRKGLHHLINAIGQLKNSPHKITLDIIGRDKPTAFQKQASQLGIAEQIHFKGTTPQIEKLYQSADLLVFPSLSDPFANVVAEAMACSLPVITTTTNGSFEIISEGFNGYVVDGNDPQLPTLLAEKIDTFLNLTPPKKDQFRQEARSTAEKLTISNNAKSILQILENQ